MEEGFDIFPDKIYDKGYDGKVIGFASDTTAILLKHYQEIVSHVLSYSEKHLDWELQLVDVRFHKIYWRARIREAENVKQLSDSAMLVKKEDGNWLLAINNPKLQETDFSWDDVNYANPNLVEAELKNDNHPATRAIFKYDGEGNIMQEPLFWIYYYENTFYLYNYCLITLCREEYTETEGIGFVDLSGNVVRY
jgi:hypothetical protein